MQMVIGLIVLILIAVGVWWYMGNGAPADTTPADTATQQGAADDVMAQ